MLNIVYAEPKHLRELVKIGHEYFNESRFKEEMEKLISSCEEEKRKLTFGE